MTGLVRRTDLEAAVIASARTVADRLGADHEVLACDPELADTAAFCAAYGVDPEESANTILVTAKSEPPRHVACVALATTRLDVNGSIRRRLGARKASFASAADTVAVTAMEIGGVTPFGLPGDLPLWIDAAVMAQASVVVGGGSRSLKLRVDPAMLAALPNAEVVVDLARPAVR